MYFSVVSLQEKEFFDKKKKEGGTISLSLLLVNRSLK
jgi:hypothetical protein